jgi:hypothetical protein
MNTVKVMAFAIVTTAAFCGSPIIDYSMMATKLDQVAYTVCWERFGVMFPQRWSCESSIKSNALLLAIGCGFKREDMASICIALDKASAEVEKGVSP